MVIVAFGLGAWSYKLLPSRSQAAAPSSTSILIISRARISNFSYAVHQVAPSIAEVSFSAELQQGVLIPFNKPVWVYLSFPDGTGFPVCPRQTCARQQPGKFPEWYQELHFNTDRIAYTGVFRVSADDLAYSVNGVTAWATIPEVQYSGPGNPEFWAGYSIPSANSYDWSSFPTTIVTSSHADWEEPVTKSGVLAREIIGLNYDRQEADAHNTFLAGALIGIAGAALLAAIQEGLHARDRNRS